MAKLLASAVVVASAQVALCRSEPYLYTVTGACDVQGSIDGLSFLKMGVTRNGSPYYKAIDSETYLYHDPDCMGSTDGTPRWIIDHDKPDVTKASDLDNDHFCDYVGRIDSDDTSLPPTQGLWTLNCGGSWEQHYLILLEGTTTPRPGQPQQQAPSTTVYRHPAASARETVQAAHGSVSLQGACPLKGFLNGLVYDEVGQTADHRPFYKARTREEYIYYDKDCDGVGGSQGAGRWLLDTSRPSATALQDLDEDSKCDYHARWDGVTAQPPAVGKWRMYCGPAEGGWIEVDLTLREAGYADRGAVNSTPKPAVSLLAAALAAACAWVLAA